MLILKENVMPPETGNGFPLGNASFIKFVMKEPKNKKKIKLALLVTFIQFMIFKLLYPFPDFFSDSYSYIYAATAHLDINIWPIGYSKFLSLFHTITYSDTALIAFQYFLIVISEIYLFFTLIYFCGLSRVNQKILFIFLFFNPLWLYISNYVNSDPLFMSLSIIWFTQLIWITYRPNIFLILGHSLILFACFTIRNNAYYYPILSAILLFITAQKTLLKAIGLSFGYILIGVFIIHTRNASLKITGTRQYSFFTGWQLANNALYIYEYADTTKKLTKDGLELDKLSSQFYSQMDSTFQPQLNAYVGNYFIREPLSPLKEYLSRHYDTHDDSTLVISWGKASAVFEDYGKYIIYHNPKAFFHEFIMPNVLNYFLPPLEKLEIYNLGLTKVPPIVIKWFHYKSNRVLSASTTLQGKVLIGFIPFFMALNLYCFINALIFWYKTDLLTMFRKENLVIALCIIFLILNFIFCICSTVIVYRYELVPLIVVMSLSLLLSQKLFPKVADDKKIHKTNSKIFLSESLDIQ